MRVGILTIHHVMNYGAVWQAYSLAKEVSRLGLEVEIIDYRPAIATNFYRQKLFVRRRLNFYGVLREYLFTRFQSRKLPLGKKRCFNASDLAAQASRYQMVIAGSDQIWCTGAGSFRGYDPNFFLEFITDPEILKVSYAASAGNTSDFGANTKVISEALKDFQAIGVRDASTAELVGKASGKSPELVLDPVFFNDFEEFDVPKSGEMIVFARNPKSMEKIGRAILAKTPMRVVSIGKECSFADLNMKLVSPEEWIRKMKGARVVLTDYFHGTAVALRFGCPVVVVSAPDKVVKITDLLGKLGLMDLYEDGSGRAIAAIENAVADSEGFRRTVFDRLKVHEERSAAFLENAVNQLKARHAQKGASPR